MTQNRITVWRQRRKMSQKELAEELGTGRSTIAKLERSERGLSQDWLRRIAEVLDVAPVDLMSTDMLAHRDQQVFDLQIVRWQGLESALHFKKIPKTAIESKGVLVAVPHENYIAVRIQDNSFNRVITSGGLAIIDRSSTEPEDGDYILAHIPKTGFSFFQFNDKNGPMRLTPPTFDPSFSPFFPESKTDFSSLGRVSFVQVRF